MKSLHNLKIVFPGRRSRVPVPGLLLVASLAGACGSGSTQLAGPTANKCQISVGAFTRAFGPGGGSGTVTVDAARECSWTATSQSEWINLSEGRSGQGPGTITFAVTPNQVPRPRDGEIDLSGIRLGISQGPAPCRFSLSASGAGVDAGGGVGSVEVDTMAGCTWGARTTAPWLRITAGSNGTGPGRVSYLVEPNPGLGRSTEVTVAGQSFRVEQAGAAGGPAVPPPATCSFVLAPATLSLPSSGGLANFTLTTGESCSWSASSDAPWASPEPRTGSGSGGISVGVGANATASPREATLSVGGASARLTQDGQPSQPACSYELSRLSLEFSSSGGTAEVSVNTGNSCPWTAATAAPWLSVQPTERTGDAEVRVQAERNTAGTARMAVVRIAGFDVSVTQEAAPGQIEVVVEGNLRDLRGSCPTVTFDVRNSSFLTTASTVYRPDGQSCSDLENGAEVAVTGTRDEPGGRITATRITIASDGPRQ